MFKNLNPGALGHNIPFEQTVELAKKYNFPGVDLDMGFLGKIAKEQSVQAAKDWFAATGLKPGAIGVGAKWRESDTDADLEASLVTLAADAKLAAALGCTRSSTWIMPASNKLNFYEHWNLVVPRLTKVARVLADNGLSFGLEFVGPATLRANFKYDFVHTMDALRALAAVINVQTGNNVGILLDCFHLYTAQGLNSDLKFLDQKEIVYVHVNDGKVGRSAAEQVDNEREMVAATGVIDIEGFMAALRDIGYDGPVTVEPFNKAVREMTPEAAIKLTSESLDKVML